MKIFVPLVWKLWALIRGRLFAVLCKLFVTQQNVKILNLPFNYIESFKEGSSIFKYSVKVILSKILLFHFFSQKISIEYRTKLAQLKPGVVQLEVLCCILLSFFYPQSLGRAPVTLEYFMRWGKTLFFA